MSDKLTKAGQGMLSVSVAPGGSYVAFKPFSFPIGTKVYVNATANAPASELYQLSKNISEVSEALEADKLVEGRDLLEDIQKHLTEITGQ